MQKSNIEIEFKTEITEEKYLELLKLFELEDNVFKQTNYYFDTDDLSLNNAHTVLRIRQKKDRYKITLKSQKDKSAYENHVLIQKDEAINKIENGFNTSEYFSINHDVTFKASLDNYRASTPYLDGVLFLDKCEYHGITDYEIEYEVNDYDEGKKIFDKLLKEHNIKFVQTKRKSERALRK